MDKLCRRIKYLICKLLKSSLLPFHVTQGCLQPTKYVRYDRHPHIYLISIYVYAYTIYSYAHTYLCVIILFCLTKIFRFIYYMLEFETNYLHKEFIRTHICLWSFYCYKIIHNFKKFKIRNFLLQIKLI